MVWWSAAFCLREIFFWNNSWDEKKPAWCGLKFEKVLTSLCFWANPNNPILLCRGESKEISRLGGGGGIQNKYAAHRTAIARSAICTAERKRQIKDVFAGWPWCDFACCCAVVFCQNNVASRRNAGLHIVFGCLKAGKRHAVAANNVRKNRGLVVSCIVCQVKSNAGVWFAADFCFLRNGSSCRTACYSPCWKFQVRAAYGKRSSFAGRITVKGSSHCISCAI